MIEDVLFSEDTPPFDWSDAVSRKTIYGPKGALLNTLPRPWTPPFALVPASVFSQTAGNGHELIGLGEAFISRIKSLAEGGSLIVRSSVVGESIWDSGRFESVIIDSAEEGFETKLRDATNRVLASAQDKQIGLVIQRYIQHTSQGKFGNLLRISKTRDHWELSTVTADGTTSRIRFNTQRDEAAATENGLLIKPRLAERRLFGSVAAWLNNALLRGRSRRVNCEWVTDNRQFYLVQIDEEDEDFDGLNPFQVRVWAAHRPGTAKGSFLKHASGNALQAWDKLQALNELWEYDAPYKPTLFYVPLSDLSRSDELTAMQRLEDDFRTLIGPDNIVIRTSAPAGQKPPNLPRTECLRPDTAAAWCLEKCVEFRKRNENLNDFAFVTHPFIPARASAWVRAEPGSAVVEVHSLWGLPDALQYFPYDIWEVHLHTEVATEYPDYKSNTLIPREDGGWEYVRIKNELARSLSIGRREAVDLAHRTASIAQRIGRACHVMWFVDCMDSEGIRFNLPWYWTEAHDTEKNVDRSNYKVIEISDPSSLKAFENITESRWKQAIHLRPTDHNLMRDKEFIESVGTAANKAGVPVILAGSTLAHAYYQLRRQNCTVITLGEKEHSRVRRSLDFGKLVRDNIPARITQRQESEITREIPDELLKGFLTGKLLEEALEVRNAEGTEQKTVELADVYEVIRALAHAECIPLDDVVAKADEKKGKAGGFEKGLVLLQTGILSRDRETMPDVDRPLTQVLARKISSDSYEIPFSFFGFMELDQPRTLVFENFGVRLTVRLKGDRIELRLSREAEQLELPLDLTIGSVDDLEAERAALKLSKSPRPQRL